MERTAAKPPTPILSRAPGSLLQRKCACGGTPGPTGECEACRKKREQREGAGTLQRSAVSPEAVSDVPPIVHEVIRAPGQPLDGATRNLMESRFGRDFSRVRLHTDPRAAESARAVTAHAYVVGPNIVFGAGRYAPHSPGGQYLLAHELAHVVQQSRGPEVGPHPLRIRPVDDPGEIQADQAASAVMAGTSPGLSPRSDNAVSRFSETRSLPKAPDGSQVDVTRTIVPGKCKLVPETRSRSSGDVNRSEAFLEINLCRGRVGGGVKGQVKYEDVLNGAKSASQNLLRNVNSGQNPRQALHTFGNDIKQLSPEAVITLNLNAPGFRSVLEGAGQANLAGQASAKGTVKADFDVGPFTISVEGSLEGGNDRQTSGNVSVLLGPKASATRTPNCFVCSCTAYNEHYSCVRRPPPATPVAPPEPIIVPLFYKYAAAVPREDWQMEYQHMLQLAVSRIDEGYTVERIIGNTSPEGPKTGKGRFEGNLQLAQNRAKRAHDDLYAAIRAALGNPLLMRTDHLQAALSGDVVPEGQGELFGNQEDREVTNQGLFKHLNTTLGRTQAGEPDPLAEQHVTGQGLPDQVRAGIDTDVEQFRSGRRGDRSLSQSERLDAIYRPLRRSLIFLKPPAPKINIQLSQDQLDQIIGTPIECTDAHRQVFVNTSPPKEALFEGECHQQGYRPYGGASP